MLVAEAKATYRRAMDEREALLWGMAFGMITMLELVVPIGACMGWAPRGSNHTNGDYGKT